MAITIDRLNAGDFGDFSRLARDSPDAGAIKFAPEYRVSPDDADRDLGFDAATYVARVDGQVVGAGRVSYATVQYEGAVRPAALLSSLMVHPRHRRRGIGTALTQHRLAAAHERLGPDGLIVANVPRGNAASLATTAQWQTALSRPFATATARLAPSARLPGGPWTVRPASVDDLDEVADRLGRFWSPATFHRPRSADDLRPWISEPSADAPRAYLVSVDDAGHILAGLGVTYLYRYWGLRVVSLPLWMRLANRAVHVIPSDQVIRQVDVDLVFHDPDDLGPAQHLWETVKQQWVREASTLSISFDTAGPLSPLAQAVGIRHGTMLQVAVRADRTLDPSRPLAPWVL
jgi:GNAT superfamily N-acetyltransferase